MIYYGNNDYRDYLAHYGVVGMHWGIRRYQPYSYTEGRDGVRKGKEMGAARKLGDAMKRAGSAVSRTVKNAGSRTNRAIKTFKNNQKAKLTEWKADRAEKKKEKVLNSGDVNTVMKYRKHLSNDEIRQATDRIMAEQRLKDLESEEAMKTIERGKRLIANVADMTRNVSSIYNTVTDVKKKMDDASEAANKKLEEKRMNDIIKTGDYEKINRAIERGDLSPEKIKTAREIIQNKQLIVEKGQKAREDIESEHREIEERYKTAAREQYEKATGIKVGDSDHSETTKTQQERTSGGRRDVVEELRERIGANEPSSKDRKISLTLNEGYGEYNPLEKHAREKTKDLFRRQELTERAKKDYEKEQQKRERKSASAKAGWQTRRNKHAENLRYQRESELDTLIRNYQSSRKDEAINSHNDRNKSEEQRRSDAVSALARSTKHGYDYFKEQRAQKDSSELQNKITSQRVEEAQNLGERRALTALEELRKKGYGV